VSQKDEIISNFKNQEWSFDTLFPDFDLSLKRHSDKSYITSRCADYYLNIENDISINKPKQAPYIITKSDGCSFWEIALEIISSENSDLSLAEFKPEYIERVQKTLVSIKKNNPKIIGYLVDYVPFILIVKRNKALSLSTPHLFGAIILSENLFYSKEDLEITLVHELAHQELFLINLIDSLISEKFLSNMKYAPFQKKDRPPLGRLHASHALFRMTEYSIISKKQYSNKIKCDFGGMIESLDDCELSHLGKKILVRYKSFYNKI